ncbi:hypothetical protein CYR40_09610 [Chimaeribacter arupi]|uniref:Uncharacterized protein n=2 Tax=Yersiniaceae TaxID=1903411 RepID=A0A2N5EKI5_9GAMM|nr:MULTISPECIES: hypothetical protein [Yersiniaceae]MBS0968481.1 hypothetical protein [Nissabacter archeti]MDV5142023.1 hypothetical protein [Chimaeribacter arupi]PLR31757.1 hypothetical protein CYR23_15360 [Chimaeribacter arupi]PLR46940.1 hypothetical protein CYR40_09610 [Chimaeribacter arupi]PLR47035.1 hypothetical protein CYR34_14935 [Chimaeribacter arupi]
MDLHTAASADISLSDSYQAESHYTLSPQVVTPVFIGCFAHKEANSGMTLTRVTDLQDFSRQFLGGNSNDLLQADIRDLPVMVSVKGYEQSINFILNPYSLFIQQAIMNWQDSSLSLNYSEDELLGMAAEADAALPANAGFMAEMLEQVSNACLTSYYAVRHYFENGGTPCYLLSVGNPEQVDIHAVTEMIAYQPEIDLTCSLLDAAYVPALQAALPVQAPLFEVNQTQHGQATHAQSKDEICLFDPRDERSVALFMLTDGENDPVPLTLAELRAQQPALAEQVRSRLSAVSLPVLLPLAAAQIGSYCQLANAQGSRAGLVMKEMPLSGIRALFDQHGLPLTIATPADDLTRLMAAVQPQASLSHCAA